MFILYANKTQLTVCQHEPITSGPVNVCRARSNSLVTDQTPVPMCKKMLAYAP